MSKFLLLALLVIALLGMAQAAQGDFESELAAEVPELAELSEDSFMTLSDLGEEANPEASFAELGAESTEEKDTSLLEVSRRSRRGPHNPPVPWHRNKRNQPVARVPDDAITCIDGDCTRAIKVEKAKVGSHPNNKTKKPPTKLQIALGAVKEEIMVRAKELHKEKDWAKKVAKLIDEYQQKLSKVTGNIAHLRAQTKALLRKKKQIQNVQVQNKLRYKLELAQADLNRLQKQMEHIAGKENEFSDTEKQLKTTMNSLKNSLLKLRGQEPQKLAKEGI